MKTRITNEDLLRFERLSQGQDIEVAHRAVSRNGLVESSIDAELGRKYPNLFSIEVPSGKITNQKQTGRCWMFAGLNIIRCIAMKKLGIEHLELSQSYLQFYDKLEKANFFLERILCNLSEPIDSRLNAYLLDNACVDGGHFAMFVNLVKKYGVVPSYLSGDNKVAGSSMELNRYLQEILAGDARTLRQMVSEGKTSAQIDEAKDKMLEEIYRILVICFGHPIQEFTFEYKDKSGKYVNAGRFTPKSFYATFIQEELDDYICLTDVPASNWKSGIKYATKDYGNVIEGEEVFWYNVGIAPIKEAVIRSLQHGEPVWFAGDVRNASLRKDGYLVLGAYQLDELLRVKSNLSKGERIDYRNAFCSHAMTFVGVNLDENGKPNRYKVANSWGEENGMGGYYIMDDRWFNTFLYQAFIKKDYLDKETLQRYENAPTIYVPPFNSMWLMME